MEVLQTKGSDPARQPRSATIVCKDAGGDGSERTEANATQFEFGEVVVLPVAARNAPTFASAVPASAHEFVRTVSQFDGVRCIIIEEVRDDATLEREPGVSQITTCVDEANDALRERVYSAELDLMQRHPTERFDFHLRVAAEIGSTGPDRLYGTHFFAVWGSLGAKP